MSQGSLKGKHNLPVSICQGMEKIEGKRDVVIQPLIISFFDISSVRMSGIMGNGFSNVGRWLD